MPEPVVGSTWTYSGDPASSDRDAVRFYAQDVDEEFPLLLDAEIDYLLEKKWDAYEDPVAIAAFAADLIARKLTALVNVSADGVEVSTEDLAERYRQVAVDLRAEYSDNAGDAAETIDPSAMLDVDGDPSIRPLNFSVGMHDNPAAGQQDYGGYPPYAWTIDWGR